MEEIVKILKIEQVTHDVKKFAVEKPKGYEFVPGQATNISINKDEWEHEKRPFTFASLNEDKNLEFIIKIYPEKKGVTLEMDSLEAGDELIIGEPWGTINYKDEGVFIGAGAGVTPFIAILRELKKKGKFGNNFLIVSNKTSKDIILEDELKKMFKEQPENLILTLTRENKKGYLSGRIDKKFLQKIINRCPKNFYICGPQSFVEDIKEIVTELGCRAESFVIEE